MLGTIGEVRMFGGNFAPRTWAFCDGQLLAISSNTALFSIIGTIYGGDGRTTFKLPDLRGRSCLQEGTGPGLPTKKLGHAGGQEETALTVLNLPRHNHFLTGQVTATVTQPSQSGEGNQDFASLHYPAKIDGVAAYNDSGDVNMQITTAAITANTLAAGDAGTGTPFDVHSPYMAVNYIICMQGVYPSRN
jgi:microcystin-dependent protein